MKARRAARELALLAFSQISKDIDNISNQDLEEIIVLSVRTLVSDAENSIKKTLGALFEIKEFIERYEYEHPANLRRPMEESNIPVPIPLTSDMAGRLDTIIDASEKAYTALELSEIASLSNTREVKDYSVRLIRSYIDNKTFVDEELNKFSKGWNIERMVRIDRDILRIATVELFFFPDIPVSVTIDEAVELAKKYSTDDSSSFINGILGQIADENNLYITKR